MSERDREWVIECQPVAEAGPVSVEWLTWPVEKDQIIVNDEDGRADWILTRMEIYGLPDIRTPFMIGWTGLSAVNIRIRKRIGESKSD